ncbi:MAG: hypothetical protein ACXVQU_04655 [Actinomycetota bacterium]
MDIVDGRIVVPGRRTGRTTAAGLALVAALSGAFALGRASTSAPVGAPAQTVVRRVVVIPNMPLIRPKGRGTVKVGQMAADGFVRHRVKWG